MIRAFVLCVFVSVLSVVAYAQEAPKSAPQKELPTKFNITKGLEKDYQIMILQYDNAAKAVKLYAQEIDRLTTAQKTAVADQEAAENRIRDFIKSALIKAGVPPEQQEFYRVDLTTGEAVYNKPKEPVKKEN